MHNLIEGLELLDVLGYPAEQLNNSYKEKSGVLCMWVDKQGLHRKTITLVVEYYFNIK